MDKTEFFLKKNSAVSDQLAQKYMLLIERRIKNEPLQYILGQWQFMSYDFKVGEGVLIPRPETEMLVEYALKHFACDGQWVFFDLCSGSGCIGISLAKLFKNASVYCIEKSEKALDYLQENVRINGCNNVTAIKGDILNGFSSFYLPKPDCVLSNPPYIESDVLSHLQTEVCFEPKMALDGGKDGYNFYKVIAKKWLPFLKIGGRCAVECGENQAETILRIFSDHSNTIDVLNDFNNIGRVVTLVRQE
ncbi:Release factor glutamine methyltransferase [bioreactor metagenome]|uniref:peptide chain release factor N(5)-glutamine methyltransferase n=1 Tax=bioreactor metagenome TaxID=1076179 RepID=A0A645E4I6_9ZZZZ